MSDEIAATPPNPTASPSGTPSEDIGADRSRRPSLPLHWQILAGLAVGAAGGLLANAFVPREADGSLHTALAFIIQNVAEPAGQIFLRLIFMVVLPLVFSALVLGVAGLGDVRRLGRLGLRTLLYTILFSSLSVGIGVGLTNLVKPGAELHDDQRAELQHRYAGQSGEKIAQARQSKSVRETLLDLIPKNLLREMVGAVDGTSPGGGMLAVMVFALLFGVAITLSPERTAPLVGMLEGLYDVSMVIVGWAMRLAPVAVAGLIFALTAQLGMEVLRLLGWYVATVLVGLLLHFFGVYSIVLALFARVNPLRFFARTSEATLTAFATSSSNATLPTSLRVAEDRLGLPRSVSSFVLTVGSTANQNGTALYEGVTVLFLAQVFGVELSLAQQFVVALLCVLAGVGTAGVPGGSLPLVVVVLQTIGVPVEGISLILGVDRLLDMCRTALNVTGDLAVATCVARAEG